MRDERLGIIAQNAVIEEDARVGNNTSIWYFSHVRKGALIGDNCSIGDHCFVDERVIIGNNVSIGNGTQIFKGTIIKDYVRIQPNVIFNNVRKARPSLKGKILDTIVKEGVCIGANATIAAGVTIGVSAQIADGTMVFFDVPDGVFVAGNPGRIKKQRENEKRDNN